MSEIERLNKAIQLAPRVLLGDLIVQCDERNSDGLYTVNDVKGVSINKVIIETKADMTGVSLSPYKLFKHDEFCFVPITSRNGDRITLSINDHNRTYIVSSSYCVFKVAETSRLLPMFLYLYFCRPEFDRYARFNSWGSAREAFSFDDMRRVRFPLPPIEVQQQYVDAYSGLRKLAEENEALLEPLSKACQAYLAEMKNRYPMVQLKDYIEELKQTNSLGKYDESDAKGVNTQKQMQSCKRLGENLSSYKIVPPDSIVYNANIKLSSQGEKFAVAKYSGARPCIVTNFYVVLRIKENRQSTLLLDYLFLFLIREDFARYIKFISCSSVRDRFDFNNMCEVCIPLPPIEVQQSIVALHRCAEEARSIAAKALETLNSICPAMIQRASHEMH